MSAPSTKPPVISPMFAGVAFFRTARKDHSCSGRQYGDDGSGIRTAVKGTRCKELITKGTRYVEHIGETAAYQSGDRYHVECAEREGLLASQVKP